MKQGEFLGLDLCAVCVASVGKKQFKMTALDVAGDDRSIFFVCACLRIMLLLASGCLDRTDTPQPPLGMSLLFKCY